MAYRVIQEEKRKERETDKRKKKEKNVIMAANGRGQSRLMKAVCQWLSS